MKRWTSAWTKALCSLLVLGVFGCASKAAVSPTMSALPSLKTYSKQFQAEMRGELPKVRACCPRTNEFVKDSVLLRDKIRRGQTVRASAR